MSKELEQLKLNMMTSLMELDYKSLLKIKDFMQNQKDIGWKEHFNDENVNFIDYNSLDSKVQRKTEKPNIVFL